MSNVLKAAGQGHDPHSDPDTWNAFLKRHAATLWQCDFVSKRKWSVQGMVDLDYLVFIHIGTWRIWGSPCTASATADWASQQARNFAMDVGEHDLPCIRVMRDNDKQYPQTFDDADLRDQAEPAALPNPQTLAERVVQSRKQKVLNAFSVVSERHLDHILRRAANWYNFRRCDSAQGNLPPVRDSHDLPVVDLNKQRMVCVSELGGHPKSYRGMSDRSHA